MKSRSREIWCYNDGITLKNGRYLSQISVRLQKSKPETRGFESSRHLVVWSLTAYLIEALNLEYRSSIYLPSNIYVSLVVYIGFMLFVQKNVCMDLPECCFWIIQGMMFFVFLLWSSFLTKSYQWDISCHGWLLTTEPMRMGPVSMSHKSPAVRSHKRLKAWDWCL